MTKSDPFRKALRACALTLVVTSEVAFCAFAEEPASPATAPAMHEQAAPPAEGADIQERGILPGLVTPSATLQPADPTFSAPTPSLTAIRNTIRVTSKSVSVNLRIPAGLPPVTVPIEISVAYISPVQTQRQTKIYDRATGLVILYREAEGDGKPRSLRLDITLRELVPNGKSFSFSKQFTITPLYDVLVSRLDFFMGTPCDLLGKSDITFIWTSPDAQRHTIKFKLGLGQGRGISDFGSRHKEISTQSNLVEPSVQFFERDPLPDFGFNPIRSGLPLLPGPTKQIFHFVLKEKATGPPGQSSFSSSGCQAEVKYKITRTLMTFDQI